jgi:hypothetical protein
VAQPLEKLIDVVDTALPLVTHADVPAAERASLLALFLADRDTPCPQCGYNLRNLQVDRCPECGEQLVLRVNAAEPRQGTMITGLVGLSAGAGMNGLLLVYLAIQLVRREPIDSWMTRFLVVNLIGLVCEGSALFGWLWQWRRIRRYSKRTRVILTVACWALTLANVLFFSLMLRD